MPFYFNVDDFGSSSAVNEAVIRGHRAGSVHGASLMMGESCTRDAVALAKSHPSLAIGLHLVLVDGRSVLAHDDIPRLVDAERRFPQSPARTWLRYLFQPALKGELEREVRAQFEAFRNTGLPLSHVDGHHHQHLHPAVFPLVARLAREGGARWIRIPYEPFRWWRQVSPRITLSKWLHGLVYAGLTRGKRKLLQDNGFLTFDGVFGLLETFSISKEYVLKLLGLDPPGRYEFFFHSGADWNRDDAVLLDPEVIQSVTARLVSFQDVGEAAGGTPGMLG